MGGGDFEREELENLPTIDELKIRRDDKRLGDVRLRHAETHEVILIPAPTNDPNDPLNWSRRYRLYIAILVCLAMFFSNFLAAGPSVAIVSIAETFFDDSTTLLSGNIAKVAYFFTTCSLLQGMGTLFWMPFIVKFGRRPGYVMSFLLYTGAAVWAGAAKTYNSELAARIILGLASGAGECLAPLTIADIFFLHERGTIMAIYTCALSAGAAGGIIVSGLITISLDWRYIYWVSVSLIGTCTLLVIFTFPETEFDRSANVVGAASAFDPEILQDSHLAQTKDNTKTESSANSPSLPARFTYWQSMRLYSGTWTQESWLKLFLRPVVLLCLPPVLLATLVMSVTIGFLVAITSNFATAMATVYGFAPWKAGLCFIAGILGALIGIFFGGHLSDRVADFFTKRNGGIREPEMRLPAIIVSNFTAPLSLVLYGVGVGAKLPWIVPTLGMGFLSFSIVQSMNVVLVYVIDSYRPIAGEITVTLLSFKAAFGFLLNFYTNPWIAQSGYSAAFGEMAAISGIVILAWIPFYIWGKWIRHRTWQWGVVKRVAHWHEDREVGE